MRPRVLIVSLPKVLAVAKRMSRSLLHRPQHRHQRADRSRAVGATPSGVAAAAASVLRADARSVRRAASRAVGQITLWTGPAGGARALIRARASAVRSAPDRGEAQGTLALLPGPALLAEANGWGGGGAAERSRSAVTSAGAAGGAAEWEGAVVTRHVRIGADAALLGAHALAGGWAVALIATHATPSLEAFAVR
jgi:hypothetical protein